MAKRSNPFTDDFVPQSKVHIGAKQFNNNEDRLKKVYGKYLQTIHFAVLSISYEVLNFSTCLLQRKH